MRYTSSIKELSIRRKTKMHYSASDLIIDKKFTEDERMSIFFSNKEYFSQLDIVVKDILIFGAFMEIYEVLNETSSKLHCE